MPRYALLITYDGRPFRGWQMQESHYGLTVQGQIRQAIERFSGESVAVNGAGRTDAGVHASGQIAHIDLARSWRTDVIRDALNAHLRPDPIGIIGVCRVSQDFDARFSALMRHYAYRISNRRANLALDEGRAWRVPRPLNLARMREGAARLTGHHDFTTFRSTECQAKSALRTVARFSITQREHDIVIEVSARSFLHNQVRSMVGTLELVGAGKWQPDDVTRALLARDRKACGTVAPPEGLTLTRVDYPSLPDMARESVLTV